MDHELKYPREYSGALRKLETTDRGHADIFNALFGSLVNNDAYLKEHADEADGHARDSGIHVTEEEKEEWDKKAGQEAATQEKAGLMGASDKKKLDGVWAGAEPNQNAFAKIKAGSITIEANGKTATFELEGDNVTVTADNATKKIVITGPAALPNPQPLAIQLNGSTAASYTGSSARAVNITAEAIGAASAGAVIAAVQGMEKKTTTFNGDGSVTEVSPSGRMLTEFLPDGSIKETFTAADGAVTVKTTRFEGNAVYEEVE